MTLFISFLRLPMSVSPTWYHRLAGLCLEGHHFVGVLQLSILTAHDNLVFFFSAVGGNDFWIMGAAPLHPLLRCLLSS